MDWRQGSYIHQHYKNNENLLDRSLVEDIEIFMVVHFHGIYSWYDTIFILELKFKLMNQSKNYIINLSEQQRFSLCENIVKQIVKTYNFSSGYRYRDVEKHISYTIEQHKKCLERFRGYGHYRYIGYMV
jgi:hypothetical protein